MYSSFPEMTLIFLMTIGIMLIFAEKDLKPWKIVLDFFKSLLTNYKFAIVILLMLAVLLMNKFELALENSTWFISNYNYDFTPLVHSYEGNLSVAVQKLFQSSFTTSLTSFMYIFVFPGLVWLSLIIYNRHKDDVAIRRTFFAFILNYLFAIPFYLFVPVNETWFANPNVHLMIAKVYPTFNVEYRQLSGLNNDFPSLHTSISWSLAFIAMSLDDYKRLAKILFTSAILIAFSTIYLGIHWLTDVIAGITLAAIVVAIAIRLSRKEFIPQLKPINLSVVKNKILVLKDYLAEITTNLFS